MKILLVDDEPLLCEYIAKCIEKCEGPYEVVKSCYRAKEALEYLDLAPVQLVITDITMPEMDGLELAETIRGRFGNNVEIAILTAHQDFEYVRQAMRSDVKNYLIKSEITPEIMSDFLARVERSRNRQPTLRGLYQHYAGSHALSVFLNKKDSKSRNIQEEAGIALESGPYIIAVFPKSNSILQYLCEYDDTRFVNYSLLLNHSETRFVFASNIQMMHSEKGETEACAMRLSRYLSRECEGYLGISDVYYDRNHIYDCYKEANHRADRAFFGGTGDVKETIESYQERFVEINNCLNAYRAQKYQMYMDRLEQFFGHVEQFRDLYPDTLLRIIRYAFTMITAQESMESRNSFEEKLTSARSFSKVKRIILDIALGCIKPSQIYSDVVQQAVDFIDHNYYRNVSLSDIAGTVHLSEEYFSRRFRQEVGLTFSDYKRQVQMREAYERLVSSKDRINIIAEDVGFANVSHFSNAFRKFYGFPPSGVRRTVEEDEGNSF